MRSLPAPDRMYQALVERDAASDGVFIVGVKTTGIFCRPTCPAKKPKRENVEFFPESGDAIRAGYRACKRCRPTEVQQAQPEWVSALNKRLERDPKKPIRERDLREMSLEPAMVRRYFKARFGMTFAAYQRSLRLGESFTRIQKGEHDLSSVMNNGYESVSGFRDAFARHFGCPPGSADDAACLKARWMTSPLGTLLLVASGKGLCLLQFVDRNTLDKDIGDIRRLFSAAIVPGASEYLDAAATQLTRYFEGKQRAFDLPLDTPGSDFQCAVWLQLQRISLGQTMSYAELANEVERPGAQRAVGRVNGQNRIAIIIPCHRVIRSDGNPGGYGGGLWRKQWLLHHEQCMIEGRELAPDSLWNDQVPPEVATGTESVTLR